MPEPKISLKMRTKGGTREGQLLATAGTSIEVALDDVGAGIGIDYTNSEALKLRLDGRVRLKLFDTAASVTGSFIKDLDTKEVSIDGTLEIEIDKEVAASMTTNISPEETTVGGTLRITF